MAFQRAINNLITTSGVITSGARVISQREASKSEAEAKNEQNQAKSKGKTEWYSQRVRNERLKGEKLSLQVARLKAKQKAQEQINARAEGNEDVRKRLKGGKKDGKE